MGKIYLGIVALLFATISIAQVGVGTTAPAASAELDVTSTNRGFLMPRVALSSTTDTATVTGAEVESLLVYNTATVGDVTPGFYYWDSTQWVRLTGGAAAGNFWDLSGNPGTTPGTNYVGTSDAQDLQLRTNGAQRMTIGATNGNVGIGGTGAPIAVKLDVDGGAGDGVFGHSNNVGGYLGYETNITIGLPGNTQTLSGSGVYANNPAAGYTSVFAQSTGSATVAAGIQYSDVWMGNYAYVDNSQVGYNPYGSYIQLNKNEATTGGNHAGLGVITTREASGNPGYTIGAIIATVPGAISGTQTEDSYGALINATADSEYAIGAEFAGIGGAGGYIVTIADDWNNRKVQGTGTVSEVIPTKNHGRVTLTCPESPEYWYQDYGTVEMVNGKATIILDQILADIIIVDEQNPIRVICTPVGMPNFNGVTIMSQSRDTVELLELNGGTHSGKLQYQLTVKPKTNYGEGRFRQAPAPSFTKGMTIPGAQAKNDPDRTKIFEWPSDWEVYGYEKEAMDYYRKGKGLVKDATAPKNGSRK
ncbi:MAG: hypothetical protein HRT68_13620 [Flavobacteriaceae bacterium]|nr:hypothetical protein [Flavobacteriaceae bacterium]